ncbi:KxYKxGKxW signal peptide domain-containing protein [Vibrio sp. M260118]
MTQHFFSYKSNSNWLKALINNDFTYKG